MKLVEILTESSPNYNQTVRLVNDIAPYMMRGGIDTTPENLANAIGTREGDMRKILQWAKNKKKLKVKLGSAIDNDPTDKLIYALKYLKQHKSGSGMDKLVKLTGMSPEEILKTKEEKKNVIKTSMSTGEITARYGEFWFKDRDGNKNKIQIDPKSEESKIKAIDQAMTTLTNNEDPQYVGKIPGHEVENLISGMSRTTIDSFLTNNRYLFNKWNRFRVHGKRDTVTTDDDRAARAQKFMF